MRAVSSDSATTAPPDLRAQLRLVLVYALIKRPFVLDLEPGKSVVEKLLAIELD